MKVAVIGSGPCGLMTSIYLKKLNKDLEVVLFEKDKDIASRIKISGNGRCNFNNEHLSSSHYNQDVSHILEYNKVLFDLLDEVGFAYYSDSEGRMYPKSESALTLISAIKDLLNKYQVEVRLSTEVNSIRTKDKLLINEEEFDYLVVSIGGVSYLNSRENYDHIFNSIHAELSPLFPSLCPLQTSSFVKSLENKRVKCTVSLFGDDELLRKEKGEVLFKSDGLSGIVIFNMSHEISLQKAYSYRIELDLFEDEEEFSRLYKNNKTLNHIFIEPLVKEILSRDDEVEYNVHHLSFTVYDTYPFNNSQVTAGGVLLSSLKKDLSMKKDSRIYIGGESLDVNGDCGGFNIAFSFDSGLYIASNINDKIKSEK